MANSKRQPKNNLVNKQSASLFNHLRLFVKSFLKQHHLANPSFLIAYSGGLDSTVLLHAFHRLQADIPFRLSAMHVHHGLNASADAWADFCQKNCAALGVPMTLQQVQVAENSGLGTEATARQARYQALTAAPADFICLAHHQDDQAETLLLQLARGAGVKGLAGMAQFDEARRLLRPFLDVSRQDLLQYATQHDLQWIEDDSNTDTAFDRNFMRHTVVPAMAARYPSIAKTLARSANHMAEADALLDDLAAIDAEQVIDASQRYGLLKLAPFAELSPARQVNVVRYWLAKNAMMPPSAAVMQQIVMQLQSTKADAAVRIKVADGFDVMRYQGAAYLVATPASPLTINQLWQGEDVVTLPDQSRLIFAQTEGEGLAYQRDTLGNALHIKTRQGGETFRPELGRPRRRLKAVMQSSQIPPWQREQMPLIFIGERLVAVPNIGVDAELQAKSHEKGLSIHWEPPTQML